MPATYSPPPFNPLFIPVSFSVCISILSDNVQEFQSNNSLKELESTRADKLDTGVTLYDHYCLKINSYMIEMHM